MLFPLLTCWPRFGNVPWVALPIGVMILGALHFNVGDVLQSYQLTDMLGKETSFPLEGGSVRIFCNATAGEQTFLMNLTIKDPSKQKISDAPFRLESGLVGTQYACDRSFSGKLKIGPLHCNPFALKPNVICKDNEWCLVEKNGNEKCVKKDPDQCFLNSFVSKLNTHLTSILRLRNACTGTDIGTIDKTTIYGLCQAMSENKNILLLTDDLKLCTNFRNLTLNSFPLLQENVIVLPHVNAMWKIEYSVKDEFICELTANKVSIYSSDKNVTKSLSFDPKINSISLPKKFKLTCTIFVNHGENILSVQKYLIIYNPDLSKYNVNITVQKNANQIELSCESQVPDGFVSALTWKKPLVPNGPMAIPEPISKKYLNRADHAKPQSYSCYLQVLVFNYPNDFKLLRVPLKDENLLSQITISDTDFDIHNGGTDSNGNTEGSGKGGPGTKGNGSNGDKSKEKPAEKSGKNNTATVVAVVLVLVVIIAAAIFAIVMVMKRRKTAQLAKIEETARQEQEEAKQKKIKAAQLAKKEKAAPPEQEQAKEKDMTFINSLENSTTKVSSIFLGMFYAQMSSIFKAAGGSRDRVYGVLKNMPDFSIVAEQWDILKSLQPSNKARFLDTCRYSDIILEYISAVFREFFDKLFSKSPATKNPAIAPDMLHMSVITDIFNRPTYIASMAPKLSEMPLFLATLIKKGVTNIVAILAQGEKDDSQDGGRFYNYFGLAVGKSKTYGDCKLSCVTVVNGIDFITRQFEIEQNGSKAKVTIVRYLSWVDFGLADIDHILRLKDAMDRLTAARPGLTLVHCSAGVGRTGTLLASLLCIQYYDFKGEPVDVCRICCKVRSERQRAIQNPAQYCQVLWVLGAYIEKLLRVLAPMERTRRIEIDPKAVNQAGSPTANQNKPLSSSSAKKVVASKQSRASKSSN